MGNEIFQNSQKTGQSLAGLLSREDQVPGVSHEIRSQMVRMMGVYTPESASGSLDPLHKKSPLEASLTQERHGLVPRATPPNFGLRRSPSAPPPMRADTNVLAPHVSIPVRGTVSRAVSSSSSGSTSGTFLETTLSDFVARSSTTAPTASNSGFSQLSSFVPTFNGLVARIRQELEGNLPKLLSLNSSRREAVAMHLDRLAGQGRGPAAPGALTDAIGGLRRWIDGARTPAQTQALKIFFEEIARSLLGQAILLKAWSDRGIRSWHREDLACLNWTLSSALKPQVPLDREGWQITKNLYSWYVPTPSLQQEIWSALESWRITDEAPSFLAGLLRAGFPLAETSVPQGYDERFFAAIWEVMPTLTPSVAAHNECDPLRRRRMAFSPTLRDGGMVRTGPASVQWIGLENYPFQLLIAELVQLWWGPSAPPVWAQGTGLEVHAKDQLSFALQNPKPSLYSRMQEIESCEIAYVLEERTVRANGRTGEAGRYRDQSEALPYFRKLRSQMTSQGTLQACVAMTKLRPGGFMWWAREEAISSQEGDEALKFLLERGCLVCEWDFSALTHQLPSTLPLLPAHLYLFRRESDLETRMSFRPERVIVQGILRSHVELPQLLTEALLRGKRETASRGQWDVHSQTSPKPQREWMERWPDPESFDTLRKLERLRTVSSPLASVTTIRPTPPGDPKRNGAWTLTSSTAMAVKGIWIRGESSSAGRRLITEVLPRYGVETQGNGHMILFTDESWISPLRAYLESQVVHEWLEHHAERKGERWLITEQVVKFIPMPKVLLETLGVRRDGLAGTESRPALPLPGEWERLAAEAAYNPQNALDRLKQLPVGDDGVRIRAALFVRTARALEQLQQSQKKLLSMVGPSGTIRWRELLSVLPKTESIGVTLHPRIRLSGTLPANIPVNRKDRVKVPSTGILLSTESGFHLHLGADHPALLDMLWEQLEGIEHATWAELVSYLKLPRAIEIAEATAHDVLRSHGEQTLRMRKMVELLSACSAF